MSLINNSRILNVLLIQVTYIEVRNIIGINGIDLYTSIQLGVTLAFVYAASITSQEVYKMDSIIDNINYSYNNQNKMDKQPEIFLNCKTLEIKNKIRCTSPSINLHEKVLQHNAEFIQYAQNSLMDDSKCHIQREYNSKSINNIELMNILEQTNVQQTQNSDLLKISQLSQYFQIFSTGFSIIDQNQNVIFQNKAVENIVFQYGLIKNIDQASCLNFEQGNKQGLLEIKIKFENDEVQNQKVHSQKNQKQIVQSSSQNIQKDILNIDQKLFSEKNIDEFHTNTEEAKYENQNLDNSKKLFTCETDQNENLLNKMKNDKEINIFFKQKNNDENDNFDINNQQNVFYYNQIQNNQNSQNNISFFSDSQEIRQQQNFLNNLNQINSQAINVNQSLQKIFLSKNLICDIKTATLKFFSRYNEEASLGDLINFIILSRPYPQINNCSQVLLEPQEIGLSPLIHRKFCKNKKPTNQNSLDQAYKYSFIDDYLILTLNRKNKSNKNLLIEIKIGCFQFEDDQKEKMNSNTNKSIKSSNNKINNIKVINDLNDIKFVSSSLINQHQCNNIKRPSLPTQKASGFYYLQSKDQQNQNSIKPQGFYDGNFQQSKSNLKINTLNCSKNICFKKYFFTIEFNQISPQFKGVVKNQVNQQKAQIYKQISLELSTPLSCIINMLDLINSRESTHEFVKNSFINPALFQSYILLNIVNDLQEKSEITQPGKVNIILQTFSLSDLCLECLNFIKLPAIKKNIQLEFYSKENVPQMIYSDLSKVRQILINLLTNALKNTQKGNICISLSQPFKNFIQVDVKDSGEGIPSDELIQMFQNLYQSTQQHINMRKDKQQDFYHDSNMSQGLKICYLLSICLGQNRPLTASSEVAKGSIFTFYIKNTKKMAKQKKISLDCNKLIQFEYFQKENSDKRDQETILDLKQIFKLDEKSEKNKNMLDIKNKTENQNNNQRAHKNTMMESTELQSSFISVEENNQDLNESLNSSIQNNSSNYKISFLTQNMIKQSQFIYQIVNKMLSQMTLEGSQYGQSTFRSKYQENQKQKSQQDQFNNQLNQINKYNQIQESQFSNQNIQQDKNFQISNQNLMPNLKFEENNINNTQAQFIQSKQDIDYEFSVFNINNKAEDNLQESCNIFPAESLEKLEPNTFIQPRIAQKSNKEDQDHIKNLSPFIQPNTPKHIQPNSQQPISSNSNYYTNSNSFNNQSRRVSQIVLKTEPSIYHSDSNIGEQKAQLLYFNVTNGFYVNGDIQNNLIQLNQNRKCDCSQILLIDDNDFNLCALELRLRQYLFIIEKASSGQQALKLIEQKSINSCCRTFTLVFLDLDMPVRNGFEVLVDIVDICNDLLIKVPSISAWTALLSEKDQQKATDFGMSHYLTKPLNLQALENVLFEEFILKQKKQL
ncbi:ATPase, histidine kinase-, DNA gyrase B (macronuclear) [Tetrahymena thermophila SB210]|uniref:histidine kinase n=1 Tax=Tetrahymena thermophila (strain SB210) TaxID=312017 RepID=Q22D61_TETTS|nr:ATPase, histidine kinase-, DNA gyrase B [Tetrahymena thermophila SB210]EAR83192.2 ATPase, histidine kinase-, DNA gyrase B [Tetrahymena thermophila SB210]|eukprot:XP_001030855.2 ATPase, histidine kinase-, DNA gyrase B [Tetrahymena thermophila SB210]